MLLLERSWPDVAAAVMLAIIIQKGSNLEVLRLLQARDTVLAACSGLDSLGRCSATPSSHTDEGLIQGFKSNMQHSANHDRQRSTSQVSWWNPANFGGYFRLRISTADANNKVVSAADDRATQNQQRIAPVWFLQSRVCLLLQTSLMTANPKSARCRGFSHPNLARV